MLEPKLNQAPQVIEKIVHLDRVLIRKKRPSIKLDEWSLKYFEENGIDYHYIAQQKRLQEIVDQRDAFVKHAFIAGYRPTEIARYLGRNHSTILHTISK
jgi:hypothetical protein